MLPFKELYIKQVRKHMQEKFAYKNVMQIPAISAIHVNVGMGKDAVLDAKVVAPVIREIADITGQMPVATKAKKSIASFKLREGMLIGCKVTLRRERMFHFLEKLVMCALPRSREFKGFSVKSFDGRGNLTFGLKEHIAFPEINYDKVDKVRGMDITIVTTAKTDIEAKELLAAFYLPFAN